MTDNGGFMIEPMETIDWLSKYLSMGKTKRINLSQHRRFGASFRRVKGISPNGKAQDFDSCIPGSNPGIPVGSIYTYDTRLVSPPPSERLLKARHRVLEGIGSMAQVVAHSAHNRTALGSNPGRPIATKN